MIGFLFWYVSGFFGVLFIIKVEMEKHNNRLKRGFGYGEPQTWGCPTPFQMLAIAGSSILGGLIFIVGFVGWFCEMINNDDSWWNKPICGKKK